MRSRFIYIRLPFWSRCMCIATYFPQKVVLIWSCPDSKVHGANMGPTWVLSAPDRPHVDPMNFVIRMESPRWTLSDGWPHWCMVACLITAPDAKTWSIPTANYLQNTPIRQSIACSRWAKNGNLESQQWFQNLICGSRVPFKFWPWYVVLDWRNPVWIFVQDVWVQLHHTTKTS